MATTKKENNKKMFPQGRKKQPKKEIKCFTPEEEKRLKELERIYDNPFDPFRIR